MNPLPQVFTELFKKYSSSEDLLLQCWNEIKTRYSEKGRHYHTLAHLEDLYHKFLPFRDKIAGWDVLLFALFYHDIIYNPLKKDNEEKSAELAVRRMKEMGADTAQQEACSEMILATKSHVSSGNNDINFFTDADLSILGAAPEVYKDYAKNVRREYAIYPDLLYNPGRKKVLKHFLEMERIFKTQEFFSGFEKNARKNLAAEFSSL